MSRYIARRLVLMVPVLIGITLLSFSVIQVLPGDLAVVMMGVEGSDPETLDRIRADLGLDRPLHIQYLSWLAGAVRGDLGQSLALKVEILPEIMRRLPLTAELAFLSLLFSLIIGTPLGILGATGSSFWSGATRLATSVGVGVPSFVIATLLLLFIAPHTPWIPLFTWTPLAEDPARNLLGMIFPVVSIGTGLAMTVGENTRSAVLEVLDQDYVRVARAKGLRERSVIWGHVLKNAAIPVISIVGLQTAFLFSGTIIIETIFGLPGLGKLAVNGINLRDYPLVQGVLLFMATAVVLINLLTDLVYAWVDPRIRYD